MGHDIEILTNVVNVGASLAVLALLLWLARALIKQGMNVVISRLFLREREASRASITILAGILVFLASNVLELYGDVFHLDWVVNEIVETGALFLMIAGLGQLASMLRVPSRTPIELHTRVASPEDR